MRGWGFPHLWAVWIGWFVLGCAPPRSDELVVWHAMSGAEEAAVAESCRMFSERSGHSVRVVPLSFGAYDAKLETAIPRGNGPDVFIAAHGNLHKWASMSLVQPADWRAQAHRAPARAALSPGGMALGYPLAFKSLLLFYDPERLDAPPDTTDAMLATALRETRNGRFGLLYRADTPYYHAPWMHGFGAAALDEHGAPSLDGPAQIQALSLALSLAPAMPSQPSAERIGTLVSEGRATMLIDGPWAADAVGDRLVPAPLPTVSVTGQPARPYLTVEAAFVATGSAEPGPAHDLARFLAGADGAAVRRDVGGQAVTHEGVAPSTPLQRAQLAQVERAVPLPTNPGIQAAWEGLARALRQTLRGTRSPEAAAAHAQTFATVLSRPPPRPAAVWPYVLVGLILAFGGVGWLGWRASRPGVAQRMRAHLADYLWVVPAAVSLGLLVVVPFITGAAVSLFAHRDGAWTFVGLGHFVDILFARDWSVTSPMSFAFTLGVTVLWTVLNVGLHVTIGVALAMLLREPWVRLRPLWRALLILPWAVPNYITALIWRTLFDMEAGAINTLLGWAAMAGGPVEIDWFARFATGFSANLITNTWLGFPFMMVVTLGALQSIPRDLEEAALVDGAGAWQRFRHVTWPMLQPALLPAVILGSVWTFNMFNVVYLVSAGEPDGSTEILISEAYRWAFSRGNRYGYAAAYAVLIFGVLVLYSRGANRLVGRKVL